LRIGHFPVEYSPPRLGPGSTDPSPRGPAYQNILDINVNGVRFIDATTLRFYGVKNGQICRVKLNVRG
jgi:hypothetical protein